MSTERRLTFVLLAVLTAAPLVAAPPQGTAFMPVDEVRPGMIGVGRTVFRQDVQEEFTATILGVLHNATGPQRDLILARLEGGPLAETGVIQGMSGSPVYIDGRLVGAVSYSLGSFPKEALAGITPIEEMTADVASPLGRAPSSEFAVAWPASTEAVFEALSRLAARAVAPLGPPDDRTRFEGPAALAALAPALRPIGAAVVVRGFEPVVDRELRRALAPAGPQQTTSAAVNAAAVRAALRAGDPVGMSLMRGDLQVGATGTVTHVDGSRVYAFGHPFLNLGPASMAMTQAYVHTVLPSLSSSMKIASLGDVIGTVTQDRATAVGGVIGEAPPEMEVHLSLTSDRAPERRFRFFVAHDAWLTPLMSYLSVSNSLAAYQRQTGVMSVSARGVIEVEGGDRVTLDNVFTGDQAAAQAAGAVSAPIGAIVANEFRDVMPARMELALHITEAQERTTIERVWLDTTRPEYGRQYQVQVQLQDYRGERRQVTIPVTMPAHADGPLTLLVSDAGTLNDLERRELDPGQPGSWDALMARLNAPRRNDTIYVRLLAAAPGTVVDGETLPALPASVQTVLQADATTAHVPVLRTVVGAWETRVDRAVVGSRELPIQLQAPR